MYVPAQLVFMGLLLLGFFMLVLIYMTNPDLAVGMMGQIMDSIAVLRGSLNQFLTGEGAEVIVSGATGGLVNVATNNAGGSNGAS